MKKRSDICERRKSSDKDLRVVFELKVNTFGYFIA